ncbi:phosphoribosylanthranilate isomerase [Maricaulis sp.]|uniref:phosphoribosylanthranilate isomerase n=1 Tax=Maricaulis sp. TaxID=1486257 RepID=UPI002631F391|nr:phosphoribosylanthranilate isomerase [Maricaulis sp.]
MRVRLKICCIKSAEEARLASAAGADALGLVGPMPSGPGTISYEQARHIARTVAPPVSRWLLSSETSAAGLIDAADQAGVDTLQIVRHLDPQILEELAGRRPHLRRVQVIHVEDEGALSLIGAYEAVTDAFLLDSGKPGAATETLGGTGDTHDWEISARFVAATQRPVMLAGGLNASNIADAVRTVRPYGIDLCSSVRSGDELDENKLTAFISALRQAEQDLS